MPTDNRHNEQVTAPDHAAAIHRAFSWLSDLAGPGSDVLLAADAALDALLAERQQDKERIERGKQLALGVLAFCREAASELDGGGLGYELAGVAADAQALLDAAALAVEEDAPDG